MTATRVNARPRKRSDGPLPPDRSGGEALPLSWIKRFTKDEYDRMSRLGAFDEMRVELLEGWIVPKPPMNPPHATAVKLTDSSLNRLLPDGWHTRVQSDVALDISQPAPDVAVVAGDIRRYRSRHPRPADIALLVEVADSSLPHDRHKVAIYARNRIAAYWIVNLVDGLVEAYSRPLRGRYRESSVYPPGTRVPVVVRGRLCGEISVGDLLPA
jgi:Uma2 family endonuclease